MGEITMAHLSKPLNSVASTIYSYMGDNGIVIRYVGYGSTNHFIGCALTQPLPVDLLCDDHRPTILERKLAVQAVMRALNAFVYSQEQ
jgi:hypothetical protein